MSRKQGAQQSSATPAEVRATEKVAAAQKAVNRSPAAPFLKLAAAGGAAYLAYYMWQHSKEPMPQPMSEAVSQALSVAGAAGQQQVEEIRGTYPGSASHVPNKDKGGNSSSKV